MSLGTLEARGRPVQLTVFAKEVSSSPWIESCLLCSWFFCLWFFRLSAYYQKSGISSPPAEEPQCCPSEILFYRHLVSLHPQRRAGSSHLLLEGHTHIFWNVWSLQIEVKCSHIISTNHFWGYKSSVFRLRALKRRKSPFTDDVRIFQ